MSLPLESLLASRFEPLVGSIFHVRSAGGEMPDFELIDVRVLGHRRDGADREPFSLTFRGPTGLRLDQGIFSLDQSETGTLDLFLVQIDDKPAGSLFEAVFT